MAERIVDLETQLAISREYAEGSTIRRLKKAWKISEPVIQRILAQHNVVVRPSGKPRTYTLNESAFDNIENSEEGCYFVGLLMADGCLTRKAYSWQVTIGLSGEDGFHLNRLREFLSTDHPLYFSPAKKKTSKKTGQVYNSNWSLKLTINSTRIAEALMKYGVAPNKSHTARVIGLENNRWFYQGLLDGDGFIFLGKEKDAKWEKPILGLVGSRATVEQFAVYSKQHFGTEASVLPMNSIWRFEMKSAPAMAAIRHFYGDAHIALPRKLTIAQHILSNYRDDGRPNDAPLIVDYSYLTVEVIEELFSRFGTWLAVANHLQMPNSSCLCAVRKRLGLSLNSFSSPRRTWGHLTAEMLLEMYAETPSWPQVAAQLGMDRHVLLRHRRRLGLLESL